MKNKLVDQFKKHKKYYENIKSFLSLGFLLCIIFYPKTYLITILIIVYLIVAAIDFFTPIIPENIAESNKKNDIPLNKINNPKISGNSEYE